MSILVYVSAPYTNVKDKNTLMASLAKIAGEYMISHPGEYAVSGLLHHHSLAECPSLGSDYTFWKDWCETFMKRCDKLLVVMFDGWMDSVGVREEIKLAISLNIPVEYYEPD